MSTHTSDEVESNKALKTSMSRQIDSIEGLEQLPSDDILPTADPSTIFDDSLEKKQNEKNEKNLTRGIELLDSDNNDDEGPALDPRIVHDDSLDKVREKEAAASRLTSTESSVQQTASTNVQTHMNVPLRADVVNQGVNSTNTDDFDNDNSYNTLEQGINSEEQSQRDTLGQLSQTQRRQGANLDIEPGRGRRDEHTSTTQGRSLVGRIANSLFPRIYHDSETLVEATLVESTVMGEIVEARRVGFCARNWKGIGVVLVCILIVFAVLLSVSLATHNRRHPDMTYEPSEQPSAPPSFDQRPTFDIVRERGHVLCGVSNGTITISGGRILHLVSACLVICIVPCISLWLTINFLHIFIRGIVPSSCSGYLWRP